jgi:hypothetical protein
MLEAYGSVAGIINAAYVYSAKHGYKEAAKQMAIKVAGLGPKRAQRFIEEVTQQWPSS